MNFDPPFPLSTIDNPFGPATGAVEEYYKTLGLLGHPGTDFNVPYGTPIKNVYEGAYVSAILSKDNPNLMAFRAVNTIVDLPGVSYEIQYGHCSAITASVGQKLALGEELALVGNTGDVFAEKDGQMAEVTQAEKEAGSTAGSHLHFQVRKLQKVTQAESLAKGDAVHRLNDGSGMLVIDGFCYEVPDFNNGFNGCIDPQQFFTKLKASDQISALAATKQGAQAKTLYALAAFLRTFGY